MLVACRRNNVKLIIGHQRRFLPSYTLARELIAEKAIGDVQMIQSFGADGLPNYCSHQTDMFRYLLSDDECEWAMGNVERKTDRWERGTRIEDCAIALYQFRCGARAMILCQVTPIVYQGAHVYGSEGMIDFSTDRAAPAEQRHGRDVEAVPPGWQVLQGGGAGRPVRVDRGRGGPGR